MTFTISSHVIVCLLKVLLSKGKVKLNKVHTDTVKCLADGSLEISVGVVALRLCKTLGLTPDTLHTVINSQWNLGKNIM